MDPDLTEDQVAKQLKLPSLKGLHVQLKAITPKDYGFLQTIELNSELIFRWRLRGSTPSPEEWAQALWQGVLAQYLVVTPNRAPIGIVVAYRANFQDQHAYVAAAHFGPQKRSPLLMLAFGMFIEYVFNCWSFRKLYLETPEFNYDLFASGIGRYFEVEGRFRDHSFFSGEHWDHLILAIYRDTWIDRGRRLIAVEWPSGMRRVTVRLPPAPRRRPR